LCQLYKQELTPQNRDIPVNELCALQNPCILSISLMDSFMSMFEASVLVCKVDLIFALNEVRLNEKTILDYWAWVKITA